MHITPETLAAILKEFGGISMDESELARVAPVVEAFVTEFSRLDELDLAEVQSALQLRADDGGFSGHG